MKRLIKHNGLLDRQPTYYAGKTVFTLGLLAVSLALLFVLDDTWFQLLNAACLEGVMNFDPEAVASWHGEQKTIPKRRF